MTGFVSTALSSLSLAANRIATAANVIGTLVVLGLVAVVNFDVVARGAFNMPFRGAIEVVQFSMVLIVFFQLPDVVRSNRLTRSDGFLILLGLTRPRLAGVIRRLIDLLSCVIMVLITVALWPEFVEMWHTNDYFGIPGVFTAPWWPIKLTIVCSAALCAVLFAIKSLGIEPDASASSNKSAKGRQE